MSGLGVPEQDQIIDVEDQGSGARGSLGHPVLRIYKAQKLLDVAEANLQGPTPGKQLQNLCSGEGEVEGEETIVAAAATGIPHQNDAQELLAGAGIPQGIDGLVPDLDLLAVKCDGGFDPIGFWVLRHFQGAEQARALLATAAAFGGVGGGFIEGGFHVHAADQLGVSGQVSADGLAGILAISENTQGALRNPTGHRLNHFQGQFRPGAILLGGSPVCLRSSFPPLPGARWLVWRLRYIRTRMGKAQYLLGAKGKATCKEKTTKLWPKAKKGRFWVERRGSWCMPAPQICRPDLRARVSSTAPTRTSAQKGNSS